MIVQDDIQQVLNPNTFVGVQDFLEERHAHLVHVRVRLLIVFSFRRQSILSTLHCLLIVHRTSVGPVIILERIVIGPLGLFSTLNIVSLTNGPRPKYFCLLGAGWAWAELPSINRGIKDANPDFCLIHSSFTLLLPSLLIGLREPSFFVFTACILSSLLFSLLLLLPWLQHLAKCVIQWMICLYRLTY